MCVQKVVNRAYIKCLTPFIDAWERTPKCFGWRGRRNIEARPINGYVFDYSISTSDGDEKRNIDKLYQHNIVIPESETDHNGQSYGPSSRPRTFSDDYDDDIDNNNNDNAATFVAAASEEEDDDDAVPRTSIVAGGGNLNILWKVSNHRAKPVTPWKVELTWQSWKSLSANKLILKFYWWISSGKHKGRN